MGCHWGAGGGGPKLRITWNLFGALFQHDELMQMTGPRLIIPPLVRRIFFDNISGCFVFVQLLLLLLLLLRLLLLRLGRPSENKILFLPDQPHQPKYERNAEKCL